MLKQFKNIYNKYKEYINYSLCGILTAIVNLTVKYLLLFTIFNASNGFQLQITIVASWIAAVLFAYYTNRKYVFESKNKNLLKEFIGFVTGRLLTLLIEMFIMWFFVTYLKLNSNTEVILFTLIAQAFVIIGNYIFSKLIVFKKRANLK